MKNGTPIETSIVRAAIYARVSSEQQAQQGTIDSQLADLRQHVEADGLGIDEELCFVDDGYTSGPLMRDRYLSICIGEHLHSRFGSVKYPQGHGSVAFLPRRN